MYQLTLGFLKWSPLGNPPEKRKPVQTFLLKHPNLVVHQVSNFKIRLPPVKKSTVAGFPSPVNPPLNLSPTSSLASPSSLTFGGLKTIGKTENDDSDEENNDPPIEEHFILRVPFPGKFLEKFKMHVKNRLPFEDLSITFKDPRHAVFSFDKQKYSARLVDLPCIIESQKTLNNKQFYKIGDVSQMLVVENPISDESQLNTNKEPLKWDDFIWPDGLATPLKNVRKRRFRKRFSNRAIEEIEKEVERLLNLDAQAESVSYELIDLVDSEVETPGPDNEDMKIEGEYEVEEEIDEEGEEAGAALQRELEMMDVEDDERVGEFDNEQEDEEDEDESDEDDDSDESTESEEEESPDILLQEEKILQDQIATNESAIQEKVTKLATALNSIIKKRFEETIEKLRADNELKKRQLGEIERKLNASKRSPIVEYEDQEEGDRMTDLTSS
ncbi:hypothetical protein G9A89_011864 [Geosiphon pyriformis]|nr:hypothetical protein G9A89_011864 [Geosiphon pyriformis]